MPPLLRCPNDRRLAPIVLAIATLLLPATGASAAPLVNGGSVIGAVSAVTPDTWEFDANAGDPVTLRIADTGTSSPSPFDPQIAVSAPSTAPVGTASGERVATVGFIAPETGTYTVLVSDQGSNNPGSYELHLARVPGADEFGLLTTDLTETETIPLGDLDTWTFAGTAGEHVTLRIGELSGSSFDPRIELYDPTGAVVGAETGSSVATAELDLTLTGTYTVLVRDDTVSGGGDTGTGTYELRFVRVPGSNEHGSLTNGGAHVEAITIGDLDTYTFSADAGDATTLRVARTTSVNNFSPTLELYDPTGALLGSNGGNQNPVATLETTIPTTGTHTVLVRDNRTGTSGVDFGTGDYVLHFARMPGAEEHGALVNDGIHVETITIGDLDTYALTLSAGQHATLRIAETSGSSFSPRLELYDPTGDLVASNGSVLVATIEYDAVLGGVHTVLVRDDRRGGPNDDGTGSYELRLARIPGANEGGTLTDDDVVLDTIDLGDLDTWVFDGVAGASVEIGLDDFGGNPLDPRVEVYDPSGSLEATAFTVNATTLAFTTAEDGSYTVLVRDDSRMGGNDDATGAYQLTFSIDVPTPQVPLPGWAGGALVAALLAAAARRRR